jgi:hypothetical protein
MNGYDKESVYDEKIAPLMHEIIKVCKAEGIPMLADFYLKSSDMTPEEQDDMHCITYIPVEGNIPGHFPDIKSRLYNRGEKVWAAAITVTSSNKLKGAVHK